VLLDEGDYFVTKLGGARPASFLLKLLPRFNFVEVRTVDDALQHLVRHDNTRPTVLEDCAAEFLDCSRSSELVEGIAQIHVLRVGRVRCNTRFMRDGKGFGKVDNGERLEIRGGAELAADWRRFYDTTRTTLRKVVSTLNMVRYWKQKLMQTQEENERKRTCAVAAKVKSSRHSKAFNTAAPRARINHVYLRGELVPILAFFLRLFNHFVLPVSLSPLL
jgi:hypothetical protein